ncbi:RNA polymerase sigma factor [Metabacillus sp. RGM 3146]|uniref:RNA polymerase sigma factor n=1 Tax=Metabacillus sp. RGM 3146 TaxID=3401092 RepID=UPI003B9A433D
MISGQINAFSLLVDRYQDMVYRVCLKMVKDQKYAEDVTQEVFIKAYETLPSFRGDAEFSTWLYKMTVHKCLDWQRAHKRGKEDSTQHEISSENIEHRTPEQWVISNEEKDALLEIVNHLKEPYKTIVKLYYLDELSYHEIMEQTGVPVKTIESQLYRARKIMKRKGDEHNGLRGNR